MFFFFSLSFSLSFSHRTLVEEHRQKNGLQLTEAEKKEIKELDQTLPVVREQQQEQRERARQREESDARIRRSSANNSVSFFVLFVLLLFMFLLFSLFLSFFLSMFVFSVQFFWNAFVFLLIHIAIVLIFSSIADSEIENEQ